MRLLSSAPGFLALGLVAWGCAVYDSGLVSTDSQLTGNGADSSGGSSGASSGSGASNSGAGKTTTGGTAPQAGEATGGTDALPEGGVPSDGGDGPVVTSGTGGTGSGGKGGAATAGNTSGGKAGSGGMSGSGGTGGGATVVKCADHPLPLKAMWTATASSFSKGDGTEADGLYNPPAHMLDGSYTERWSTGQAQGGNEWIQLNLGAVSTITDLTLNPGNDAGDYPRSYAVRVSNKDQDFAAPVKVSGAGMPGTTFVHFSTPVVGQFITVRQTGIEGPWWTVAEALVGCTDP